MALGQLLRLPRRTAQRRHAGLERPGAQQQRRPLVPGKEEEGLE